MISNIDTQQMDVLKGYLDPPIIELTAWLAQWMYGHCGQHIRLVTTIDLEANGADWL